MSEPETLPMSNTLRLLIADDTKTRTIKQLAADSDVPYQAIQKWLKGETRKLDVSFAERVYQTLTGKTFEGLEQPPTGGNPSGN